MGCHAGVRCESHKATFPKIGEIEKTGPRWLKGGIVYEPCTLLKLGEDRETYEPITLEDLASVDAGKIVKASTGTHECDFTNTPEDQSCSVGVILRGCLIADHVCWPEGYTQEMIDKLIACSNCCLTFVWLDNTCPPAPEGTAETETVAALPKNTESEVVKGVVSKADDTDPEKTAALEAAEAKADELDKKDTVKAAKADENK